MEVYSAILGRADAPDVADTLHALDHAGRVDEVRVARADLARRRMRARTRNGHEVGIALPRGVRLCDGALLRLDAAGALVVRVEAEHWLRLRPADAAAALRVGYHVGNLHWRVRFDEAEMLVGLEGEPDAYVARLADLVADGVLTVVGVETGR